MNFCTMDKETKINYSLHKNYYLTVFFFPKQHEIFEHFYNRYI